MTEFINFYFEDRRPADVNYQWVVKIDYNSRWTSEGEGRRKGVTFPNKSKRQIITCLHPSLLTGDARDLYGHVVHEIRHANDLESGQAFEWMRQYPEDAESIMEYYGWKESC